MSSEGSGLTQELHLSALTEDEHEELVTSALKIIKSVVKLVEKETEKNKHLSRTGFGTAFVVHRDGARSFLLSCAHVIHNLDPKTFVVRFMAEGGDAALECGIKVIAQDDASDLLLFSIEEGPAGLEPLEFSTAPVKRDDKVAAIGFSFMVLPDLCKKMLIINEPSIMTGKILVDSFDMKLKKANYTCKRGKAISDTRCTAGNSGSPIIRDGKVIAVHCGADAAWRESATVDRVLQFLKLHLKKSDSNATIVELLQEIAEKEKGPQRIKSKREGDGKEAPQTSKPNRCDKTYTRRKHKREHGSADGGAKET